MDREYIICKTMPVNTSEHSTENTGNVNKLRTHDVLVFRY